MAKWNYSNENLSWYLIKIKFLLIESTYLNMSYYLNEKSPQIERKINEFYRIIIS